jgi:hypothetical protein
MEGRHEAYPYGGGDGSFSRRFPQMGREGVRVGRFTVHGCKEGLATQNPAGAGRRRDRKGEREGRGTIARWTYERRCLILHR